MEGRMVDVFVGFAGFNAIMDTLKNFKGMSDANIRNTVAVELQEKILTAYQNQLSLNEEISALNAEVTRSKDWSAEKARYELKDVGQGSLAYGPKQGMDDGEPPHSLCANCYTKGKKTILQQRKHVIGRAVTLDCHECRSSLVIQGVLRD